MARHSVSLNPGIRSSYRNNNIPDVRKMKVVGSGMSSKKLISWAKSSNPASRADVARSELTPPSILLELMDDPSYRVRLALLERKIIPREVLLRLSDDLHPRIRHWARQKLKTMVLKREDLPIRRRVDLSKIVVVEEQLAHVCFLQHTMFVRKKVIQKLLKIAITEEDYEVKTSVRLEMYRNIKNNEGWFELIYKEYRGSICKPKSIDWSIAQLLFRELVLELTSK